MAKKSKKALGAAMAGVMAVGAVAGTANTVATQVKADVASDVQAAHNQLEHLRNSLHNNYLGIKNQPTWEGYAKNAQNLINKLPNGSTKTKFQERLDRANAMILAAASVNHAEFSIQKNYPKADNAEQWLDYADKSLANIQKVDEGKEYTDRTPILLERIEKVQEFAEVVLDLEDAREAKDVEAMELLKDDAEALMTYFREDMNYKDLMVFDLVDVINQRIEEAGGTVEKDTEAPVIKVEGETSITLENGAEFKVPAATATDNVDKEVKVTSVIKDAAGKEIKAIDTKVAGTYTITYSATDAAGNKAKDVVVTVTVKEGKLAVESVSAINAVQVKVVFNQAVDKDSAEKASNYTVGSLNLGDADAIAKLQADGKTVILTLDADGSANLDDIKLINNQKYNVVVKNVKTSDNKVVEDTTITNVELKDTTIPTYDRVDVVGPNKIKVYFSEPVKAVSSDFVVDNGSLSVSSVALKLVDSALELTLSSDLKEGEHKIQIKNTLKDYVGYAIGQTEQTFNVVKDTVAPVVSVKKAEPNKVTLEFDKAVKNLEKAEIKVGYNKISAENITSNPKTTDANDYSTVWYVSTGSSYITGNTVEVSIKNNADGDSNKVVDRWNNKLADTILTANVEADTTKPAVTGLEVLNAKQVKVGFNKEVVKADAENRMNYTLLDKDGKLAKISGVTDTYGHPLAAPSYDNDKKEVTVTFGGDLLPEAYTLKIEGIKDTVSYNQQKIDETKISFSVADKTKLALNEAAWDGTDRKITVTFNKSVAQSGDYSALDLKNYTIDGKALPSGSSVSLGGSDKVVVITVGGADNDIVGKKLAATINDSQGNLIDVTQASTIIKTASISTSDIKNFKLIDNNTVTFDVLKPLSEAKNASGFTVNDKNVASVEYVNQNVKDENGKIVYGATVTIKTDKNKSEDALGTSGGSWTVNIPENALKTASGALNAVINESVTVADYASAVINKISTLDTADTKGMIDKILVEYSENINSADISKDTFVVDGYTVKNAYISNDSGVQQTSASKYVAIELVESGKYDTDSKPSVKQVKDVRDISSEENVKKAESSASVSTEDGAAPVIISAVKNGEKITVTFSEKVTGDNAYPITGFKSLESSDFTESADGSITGVTHSASSANVVVLDVTGEFTSENTINATSESVYDYAKNAAGTDIIKISGSVVSITGVTGQLGETTQGSDDTPAKAPVWNTGTITAIGDNDSSGKTFVFDGATITVKSAGSAVTASASNGTTGEVTIANSATSQTTAEGIIEALNAVKAKEGSPLKNYEFELNGSSDGILITGLETLGDTKNSEKISGTVTLTKKDITTNGVTFVAGKKESAVLTITGTAKADGTLKVTLTNPSREVTVPVTKDQTNADIATAIKNALGTVDGYKVTDNGDGTIKFEATSVGDVSDDLTVTVANS